MAIARQKTRQRELREARALIRRVQRGDRRAFELLYTSYEGRVYRFCHRLTGDDRDRRGARRATFARALADLPEGGLDTLDVPAYLLGDGTFAGLRAQRQSPRSCPRQWAAARSPPPTSASRRGAHGAGPARSRGASRRRDRRVRSAPRSRPFRALVGTARLRLHARAAAARDRCSPARAGCPRCRPMPTARWRPRSETSSSRTSPAARTAAPRCSRCARPRCAIATLPVPEPPGELGSRIGTALGAVGLPARASRSSRARRRRRPQDGGGRGDGRARARGRRRHDRGRRATTMARPSRPRLRLRRRPSPRHSRARRCPTRPWRSVPSACL